MDKQVVLSGRGAAASIGVSVADRASGQRKAPAAANRELIERFERKIAAAIGRVWGES